MRKRQKRVSEEENRQSHRSSSTSLDISELIPIDLLFDIFSRLPHKTIAKCHCVSKLWSSILSRPDFIHDLILKRSSAHPRLLFTFNSYSSKSWCFFSSPQPIKPDENLPLLAVDDHIRFPTRTGFFHINTPVHGLLCTNFLLKTSGCGDSKLEVMVYNPSTGESMTLPKVKTNSRVRTYLGYDPINRQSKVLCISLYRNLCAEHQVLTLRTEELSWRKIECSLPAQYYPMSDDGICINGVLYYIARQNKTNPLLTVSLPYIIVCFHVMSEKFTFIDQALDKDVTSSSVLINYGGKLGVIRQDYNGFFTRTTKSLVLWVLDGVKKHKWLKMIYLLPLWNNLVADHTRLNIVGRTSNGEIVFSPMVLSDPFYIFFYNVETKTIKRVEIQGIGPVRGQEIYTFINHTEDMTWMRYNIAK